MYESVVRASVRKVDEPIFDRAGNDGCIVNDAIDVDQRAVVGIANGRLCE